MKVGVEKCAKLVIKMCYASNENDTWRMEWNCQIKTRLKRSEKKKLKNTTGFWKVNPLNKWRWKKN